MNSLKGKQEAGVMGNLVSLIYFFTKIPFEHKLGYQQDLVTIKSL